MKTNVLAMLLSVGLLLFSGCASHPPLTRNNAPPPVVAHSIYQSNSGWTNDLGAPIDLRNLRGQTAVMTLFYTSCQTVCPATLKELKEIEAILLARQRKEFHFILVSFDAERDGVSSLRSYRRANSLNASRWTLLRGSPENIATLAGKLGVTIVKDQANGKFYHTNLITVLNAEGEIVYQQPALERSPSHLIQAIEQSITEGYPNLVAK